jgi:hypothetical protein
MKPQEKGSISFGAKDLTAPLSPTRNGSENDSDGSPGRLASYQRVSPLKPHGSLDLKNHSPSMKAGLYHTRYNKNVYDAP